MRLLDDSFFAKVLQRNYADALEVKIGINMLFLIHLIFLSAFGLIAGIAGLDLLTNTSSEIGIFLAGVILESLALASCLVIIRTTQIRLLILCFIAGIWGSSLVFFGYFNALPGRFAWHYLIAEPADSWNLASNYFRAYFVLAWIGAVSTLYAWTYFTIRKTSASERRIPFSWVVPAALLLTGVTLNGFRTNPGKGSPGLDFCFSMFRTIHDLSSLSNNDLIRLQPRISMSPMRSILKPMPFNILVIVHESLRSDRLSLYGYQKKTTPILETWLDKLQGTTHEVFKFQQAFSNATYTHVSYPSLLSGIHPLEGMEALHTKPLIFDHIKRFVDVQTAIISAHSYQSGNYAAFLNTPVLDRLIYRESEGWKAWNNVGADDSNLPSAMSKFLDNLKSQKFFIVLHHNGTHFPYKTTENIANDDPGVRYDESIIYVDSIMGRVLSDLKQRGLMNRTLIVITSDHGESFGENGTNGHFGPIHPSNAQIPFLWIVPKQLEIPTAIMKQNVDKAVSNLDIVPTILGMLGIQDSSLLGRELHKNILGSDEDIVIYNNGTGQNSINFAVTSAMSFRGYSYFIDSKKMRYYRLTSETIKTPINQSYWLDFQCKASSDFSQNLLLSCPIPTKSSLEKLR